MILQPNYYDSFKCTADKCNDNCCIGWEIDIDENTFNKYMNIGGNLGNRLKNEIITENETHYFKLKENDRCPFLNNKNLCDIICELGEDGLCQICNDHPRYINSYGNITERGLGLACEEACRIILNQKGPAYLIDSESKMKYNPTIPEDSYLEYLYKIRNLIIDILQNKSYKITERIACVIEFCTYIQTECISKKSDTELLCSLDNITEYIEKLFKNIRNNLPKNNKDKNNIIKNILTDYTQLEILDKNWKLLLNSTINSIENCNDINLLNDCNSKFDNIYENMLIYLTHRYFLESYYDNMIVEKALFMLSTYIVVKNIAKYTDYNIIDIIHSYSKEIEYSDMNIETLYSKYSINSAYDKSNIYTLLSD